MTTPKSSHNVTAPTENLLGLIISNVLQIAILAKYFSVLIFSLLQ